MINRMLRYMLVALFACGLTVMVPGCKKKTTAEDVGREIDNAVEETGEAVEEAAEELGEAVEDVTGGG